MSIRDIYKPRHPMRTTRHRIRGADYAVSEWGEPQGPLLVWLHGYGDCGATFQFVVDAFETDWHVIAPDFRGFGKSEVDTAAFWFPDYLADLDRILDRYSPDAPVRLVGHSMGGNIGGLYAGALPERVRAFINVEGFGLADSDPGDAPARYRHWIEASRSPQAFSSYPDFAALAARIRKRNPQMSADRAEFVARHWGRQRDGRVELHANPQHKLPNPILYRRAESEACWRNVGAPVLLVAGSASPFATAADPGLDIGSLDLPYPNAEVRMIDGAGHMMHFETPEALAAIIESFFGEAL